MELEPWTEIDATTWAPVAGHVVGKREKRWRADQDGEIWLEKFPKEWRPSELAIEVFASTLARAIGIDASSCYAAVDGGRQALVSRRFLEPGEQLVHGDQLLEEVVVGYDSETRPAHTLGAVREAIEQRLGTAEVMNFARVLAFDAWVGHGDRHQQNWGIIVGAQTERLTPLYDTAACLGAELRDEGADRVAADAGELRRYSLACPSGFGDGSELVSMIQVVIELERTWPEWRPILTDCLSHFESALAPGQSYLRRIPDAWLSSAHRHLACALLGHRLEWLAGTLL